MRRGVPRILCVAIAGDIDLAVVVANVFRRVIERVERISFPVLARQRTKCCVRPIRARCRRTAAYAEQSSDAAGSRPDCFSTQRRRMNCRRGRGGRSRSRRPCPAQRCFDVIGAMTSDAVLVADIVSGAACRGRLQRDFRSRRQRSRQAGGRAIADRDNVGLDALSALSVGKPAVITPSKKEPAEAWLLSPPMPRMIAPSWRIGAYPREERRNRLC
jgi:hypothetical protein